MTAPASNTRLAAKPIAPIELADEEVTLDFRGCAFFPRHRLLVVSDLHFEKGSSFARRGILLPPYDTQQTLSRLAGVIAEYDPAVVVCLGDSFHDREGHSRLADGVPEVLDSLASGRDWCWILGNHDPDPPPGLAGFAARELAVGQLVFRHEPLCNRGHGEVAGHLHPGARVHRRGRSLRRPCFASDGMRLIMPAFGAFTGCLNVRSPAFESLFDWQAFSAYLLGERGIYPVRRKLLLA